MKNRALAFGGVLLVISAIAVFANSDSITHQAVQVSKTPTGGVLVDSDCEKARERCVESCANFRRACDRNHQDDQQYCIDQQNLCEAKCNEAWKKCNEGLPEISK